MGKFTDEYQGLCCSYVAWSDGSFSCDLSLGNKTQSTILAQEYVNSSSIYIFTPQEQSQEKSNRDYSYTTVLNVLSVLDLIQDFIGIALGLWISPWILSVTIPMTIGDILSIYLQTLEKPFIFFESKFLEGLL